MITDPSRVPLGRRAWIGDGRHGASVAADGTIDWYCSAGVEADPDLWRLLDPQGAAVRVGPVGFSSGLRLPDATQSYREGTNAVETTLVGPGGRQVAVVDFMPWPGPGLEVPGMVVRLVRALSGPAEVEVEVLPGPRRLFGGQAREVAVAGGRVVSGRIEVRADRPFVPEPLERDVERWRAVIRLDAGQETVVTVGPRAGSVPERRGGSVPGLSIDGARRLLDDTEAAWRSWLVPLYYAGPYRRAAERAALAIRSLTAPGGAPRAAGTSSLPRRVGSERTSDDRWVHLRDVAEATRILARLGLAEDAAACEEWLRGVVGEADRPWPDWLDVDGQPVAEPSEWPFSGWRRSQPVVSGRVPVGPDVGLVGAVVAAVGASTSGPGGLGVAADPGPLSAARTELGAAVDWVADHWHQPDSGRWEIERPRRRYVASRVEAWTALDRMTRLARVANPLDLDAVGWQGESRSLFTWLEDEGVGPDGGLRMSPNSDEADAALLPVAWSGPWPARHPVVAATVDRVLNRLSSGPLVYRYSDRVADERSGPDNPDLEASFMTVRALAELGRWDDAHERMEAVIGFGGQLGAPLAQTAEPVSGEMFGNFPATAVCLALLDAAAALEAGPR